MQSPNTLTSIIVIHRHGDRTPQRETTNDISWKEGYGALTEKGVNRMRQVGQLLRERYTNLWDEKSDIQVHSSDTQRTIKSVENLLEGVYSEDIQSISIPINIVPLDDDKMLYQAYCSQAVDELNKIFNTPENVEWFNNLKPLWSLLGQNTGQFITKLDGKNRVQIHEACDTYRVLKQHNLPLPEWMSEDEYNQLNEAGYYEWRLNFSTPLLQRITAGLLFNEIQDQMNAIERCMDYKKVRVYSTHEAKITAILMALNAYSGITPLYGATIVFEFYTTRPTPDTHFVKAYHLRDTTSRVFEPITLSEEEEDDGCPFHVFKRKINHLVVNDWFNEFSD